VDLFIISVVAVMVISAVCSLSEAAIYAVAPGYVRRLTETGAAQGRVLSRFKEDIGIPITAILVLNTVSNTAGAVLVGAQARALFGNGILIWFSILFTIAILTFSEIIPKIVGVNHSRTVSRLVAIPLNGLVRILWPAVWLTQRLTKEMRSRHEPIAPESEMHRIADLSAEEGSILPEEAVLVKNVLKLDEIKTRDIMTPRTVVFNRSESTTVNEVSKEAWVLPHARIPIHDASDADHWTGVVLRRDILAALARDAFDVTLKSLAETLIVVPDSLPGNLLLQSFLKNRTHLFGVAGEYGNVVGIVTLEDVLEELIGEEIVDETDRAVDMREVAMEQRDRKFGKEALDLEPPGSSED
jgi:CBS domain containing-hemolysin-like protein